MTLQTSSTGPWRDAYDMSGHAPDGLLRNGATIGLISGSDAVHVGCIGHYVEIGSLPRPTATERVEVFDTANKTLFSFPTYDNGDLNVVYVSSLLTNTFSAWNQSHSFNHFKTYWGRGVSDGTNLYYGGVIDTALSSFAGITNGSLAQWQATAQLPTLSGSRGRSLHQSLIYRGRLYVLGGWYGDGSPGYSDVSYACIAPGGALSSFASTTSLPEPMWGHSAAVSPQGKIYVANKTNLFISQIKLDGTIDGWLSQPAIPGMDHINYGNTAVAVVRNLLIIVDESNTYLCRLNSSGFLDSHYGVITNPSRFSQRSVFTDGTNVYVTAINGKLYRLDNLPMGVFPNAGIVAWWTGDGTTDDEMSNNPVTLLNGTSYGTGLVDQAFKFDGVDDWAITKSSPDLNISNAITLEAWIKHDALGTNVQRYVTLSPEKAQIRYDGAGGFHFSIKVSGTFHELRPGIMPIPGRWYHVVGTYDGAVQRFYLNGSLVMSQPVTGKLDPQLSTRAALSASSEPMSGIIDEALIYNRALSTSEISHNYQAQSFGMIKTPRLNLTATRTPGGITSVAVRGKQGIHTIESSQNLTNWSKIGTVTNLGNMTSFADPATNETRFYRAVSP